MMPRVAAKIDPILLDVPMPIRTPRLLIKPREIGEGKTVHKAVVENYAYLEPWIPRVERSRTLESSESSCRECVADFVKRTDFVLSIYDPSGKEFLGSTGIHRPIWEIPSFMIGYWVAEKHQGKGFITEAVNALTRYCFEVFSANRVYMTCDSRNARSLAVMDRLGFTREGLLKNDSLDSSGTLRDTIITARYSAETLPPLEVSWGGK
jgi:RimJ/RimL family protein N-acetyltransferase